MGVNPYWSLLRGALQDVGVEFDDSPSWSFSRRWLSANRGRVQVVHFHSVRHFWEYELTQARLRWVLRFARNVLLSRALGYRTVFTVHDLRPLEHSLLPDWVDFLGHWLAVRLVDAVIVHYETGRKLLTETYGRRRNVYVVCHPSFDGVYPSEMTAGQAKSSLGYSDQDRVITCFGGIRQNKGIEDLISAFESLPGENLRLLIAGQPWPPASYVDSLKGKAEGNPRIRIVAELIPDDQVQAYLRAADVVVLPFRQILNSSSTILAMTFGRPVVAPAIGCLTDVISADSGLLYDPADPHGLRKALLECQTLDLEAMGRRAGERVREVTWHDMARQTLRAYGQEA